MYKKIACTVTLYVKCSVRDCQVSLSITNPEWTKLPKLPSRFDIKIPEDWYKQRKYRIRKDFYLPESLFCPIHAPIWKRYAQQAMTWQGTYRKFSRFLFNYLKSIGMLVRGKNPDRWPKMNIPTLPFELVP